MSEANALMLALGQRLRGYRESAGLTMQQVVGDAVGISQATLSKIENGKYPAIARHHVESLASAYHLEAATIDALQRLRELAVLPANSIARIEREGFDRKQLDVAADEAATRHLRHFGNIVVPGLLQLPDYSRAVLTALGVRGARLERAVHNRLQRQSVLAGRGRQFTFVLGESVLYTVPGVLPHENLVEQLDHLTIIGLRPNIEISIVPLTSGNSVHVAHDFNIYDDRLVTAETMAEETRTTSPTELARYARAFQDIYARAVSNEDARALIERARDRVTTNGHQS